jgi:hypothetical protein
MTIPQSQLFAVPLYLPTMNTNNNGRLWSLWAAAGLWVGGGKRAAFSTGHPQDCAQRKGGSGAAGCPQIHSLARVSGAAAQPVSPWGQ